MFAEARFDDLWSRSGHVVEIVWVAFAAANLVAMFAYPTWVSIPFHLIWVSFALLYGVRTWGAGGTAIALTIIALATGGLITVEGLQGGIFPEKAVEVPLMVTIFAIMAWHVRRYSLVARELRRVSLANEELAQRERRFVQAASHELRTPITVALGHAELIARTNEDPQTRDDVAVVLDELHRLRRLTAELLRFEVVTGSSTFAPADTAIEPVLRKIVHRWAFADRRWRLDVPRGTRALIDRARLEPALDALVDNAVRHTETGDEIVLWAAEAPTGCRVCVTDVGEGISPEEIDHVFDRFHRGGMRPAHADRESGFGLGLALVREVAQMHGGDVTAESEGGRTTLSIELPRQRPAQARPMSQVSGGDRAAWSPATRRSAPR